MFTCSICHKEKQSPKGCSTGYGLDTNDNKVCFECCGFEDRAFMLLNDKTTLYLSKNKQGLDRVTNWPNSLEIKPSLIRKGSHNMAGTRYDVWFWLDGRQWHGIQYGENTQILHCKAMAA